MKKKFHEEIVILMNVEIVLTKRKRVNSTKSQKELTNATNTTINPPFIMIIINIIIKS